MRSHLLNLLLLSAVAAPALADEPVLFRDSKFAEGKYGPYPTQTFHTSKYVAPRPNFVKTHENCSRDDLYTFWNPRGWGVPQKGKGPMILDRNGSLIWTHVGMGDTYNLNVQKYKGQSVLTFWAGDDTVGGHGQGYYYLYDQHYTLIKKIGAVNGLKGDLHEFRMTDDNHAIISVYETIDMNLTAVGGEAVGRVWNGLFQEINVDTNELIFQWNASEWFDATSSYRPFHPKGEGRVGSPWDYFHINSVQKDRHGNYLVSGRYSHAATYIDGKTGKPIWFLGGKRNNFKDLSDGEAINFSAQHDCRFHDDGTTLTVFDNAANWEKRFRNESRAVRIGIDTRAMTATLLAEYKESVGVTATSQGSAQVVDGKEAGDQSNVLVGYGYVGAFSEFNKYTGEEICAVQLQPPSAMERGAVQSYRTEKYPWVGRPLTRPTTVFHLEDSKIWVSWLGATEVRYWSLQDLSRGPREVLRVPKQGFETEINATCPKSGKPYGAMRVVALDANGKMLSVSLAMGSGLVELHKHFDKDGLYTDDGRLPTAVSMFLGALLVVFAILVAGSSYFCYRSGRSFLQKHRYGRIRQAPQYELAYNDSDSLDRQSAEIKDVAFFERDDFDDDDDGGAIKFKDESSSSRGS